MRCFIGHIRGSFVSATRIHLFNVRSYVVVLPIVQLGSTAKDATEIQGSLARFKHQSRNSIAVCDSNRVDLVHLKGKVRNDISHGLRFGI